MPEKVIYSKARYFFNQSKNCISGIYMIKAKMKVKDRQLWAQAICIVIGIRKRVNY